ncbi:MAG: DUF2628 domain-containing protein [Alphaproteobacteria bacterium]
MRVYTVHIQAESALPDGGAVLVKEGFSWPALMFGPIWALGLGLWVAAAALLAAGAVIGAALELSGADFPTRAAIVAGFQVLVGFTANDFRRWSLARRGFADARVVAAPDRLAAERRYFEARNLAPRRTANSAS